MSVFLSVRASARPSLSAYMYISDCPSQYKSNRKAMNRNWSNQMANPALKTKAGNK